MVNVIDCNQQLFIINLGRIVGYLVDFQFVTKSQSSLCQFTRQIFHI